MKIGALYPSPEGKGFTANRDKKEENNYGKVIVSIFCIGGAFSYLYSKLEKS